MGKVTIDLTVHAPSVRQGKPPGSSRKTNGAGTCRFFGMAAKTVYGKWDVFIGNIPLLLPFPQPAVISFSTPWLHVFKPCSAPTPC